jgi:hypothetical protein
MQFREVRNAEGLPKINNNPQVSILILEAKTKKPSRHRYNAQFRRPANLDHHDTGWHVQRKAEKIT